MIGRTRSIKVLTRCSLLLLLAPYVVSSTPGPPIQVVGPTFGNKFQALCSGSAFDLTLCLELLYNATVENYYQTKYLSRQNEALSDASESAVSDWNFAVADFDRLEPLVQAFVRSGNPTMQTLVNQLASNVSTFNSSIQPQLSWLTNASRQLFEANDKDMQNLTQQVDLAGQSTLQQVISSADLVPNVPSRFSLAVTRALQDYWNSEFPRIQSLIASDQERIGNQAKSASALLSNISSYLSNSLNSIKVDKTNLTNYMANNSVINRIAASQNSLHQFLKSIEDQTLSLSPSSNNQLSSNLTQLIAQLATVTSAANKNLSEHFNASLDSLGEAIDANITAAIDYAKIGESKATQNYTAIDKSFSRDIKKYSDLLTDAATAVGAMRSANDSSSSSTTTRRYLNISNPFLVTDADLGPDSLAAFEKNQAMVMNQLNESNTNLTSLTMKAKTDMTTFANQQIDSLNQSIAARTMLVGPLSNPNMTSGIDPVFLNWTKFSAGVRETTLPGVFEQFKKMISNISDWVFKSEYLSKLSSSTSQEMDPNIASLMTGNFEFLNKSDLSQMDNFVDAEKSAIQIRMKQELGDIENAVFRAKSSTLIDDLETNSTKKLEKNFHTFSDQVDSQQADADNKTTTLALNMVEKPAANLASILTSSETRLKYELGQLQNLQTTISQLLNKVVDTNKSISESASTMASTIEGKKQTLARNIAAVLADMNRAISDYSTNFETTLPTTSGLLVDVENFEKQIANVETNIVGMKSDSMKKLLNKKIQSNKDYIAAIESAGNDALVRGKTILDGLENVRRDISFSYEVPNESALVNGESIIGKAQSEIEAQSVITKNLLNQKVGELVQAVQSQSEQNNDRVGKLSTVQTQVKARDDAANNLRTNLGSRVGAVVTDAENALKETNATISELNNHVRDRMLSVTNSFVSQSKDLLHHVSESVPKFLSTFEKEQAEKILQRITEMNSTVNAINNEAKNQFGIFSGGSFLDKEIDHNLHPSKQLVELLNKVKREKQQERLLEDQVWETIKNLNSSLNTHINSIVPPEPHRIDPIVNESISAIDRVLNASELFARKRHVDVKQTIDQTDEVEKEDQRETNGTVSSVEKMVKIAHHVIGSINDTERNDVQPGIGTMKERLANIREIVGQVDKLSNWTLTPLVEDVKSQLQQPVPVAPEPVTAWTNHQLQRAIDYMKKEILNETSSLLDSRIVRQSDSLSQTIDSIRELGTQLESLSESEDKLESEFETKIISKFKKRNEKYEEEFAANMTRMNNELKEIVGSFPSKSDMQDQLHEMIRNLRRQQVQAPNSNKKL